MILKYTLIFANELVLSEMGGNLFFVTIFLPEFINDQGGRLAFSPSGEVASVFKGKHKFSNGIRNGKRHVKIFPMGEDPEILPRKIYFIGSIQTESPFAEKVVLYDKCKTRQMLGENCTVATPTPEDSRMFFSKQSGTPPPNQNPVQPDPFVEFHLCHESLQKSSALTKELDRETPSGEGSDSDSDEESCSDYDSQCEWPLREDPRPCPCRNHWVQRIKLLRKRLLHGSQRLMNLWREKNMGDYN